MEQLGLDLDEIISYVTRFHKTIKIAYYAEGVSMSVVLECRSLAKI